MLQIIVDSALKTGTTLAILKTFGNITLKKDLLISSDNVLDITSFASLRIFAAMLFRAEDLLTYIFWIDL